MFNAVEMKHVKYDLCLATEPVLFGKENWFPSPMLVGSCSKPQLLIFFEDVLVTLCLLSQSSYSPVQWFLF